ncbi:haloacid dehalogenase-like hydrolase [Fusarium albosuccineum]|uniref:Haloacid dehalogenase-like hydrolase n=1 Tax=Fusarium albosuccineum TaxID=1237068 RepID=A0A8H4LQL6_9HYPO|nr:haloacid dehalogenase-like hydrolase [Fusarium albosuccineum]
MLEARSVEKFKQDVVVIPGARPFLEALSASSALWAIVTSGTEPGTNGWIETFNLPGPDGLVAAESVTGGEPDPTCYQMGLSKLGLQDQAAQVLVLEDSPAGIKSGNAANCKALAVVATHSMEQIMAAGPDWIVKDLDSIKVVGKVEGRIVVEISDVLWRRG